MRVDEVDQLRTVRLAALRESPDAFGPTYEVESQRSRAFWEEWAAAASAGDAGATFFAEAGPDVVGIVGAYRPGVRGDVEIFGMWIAARVRGAGAGRQLLEACLSWADECSPRGAIGLWVTEGNEAATRLYSSVGFDSTGKRRPLPSNHALDVVQMVRLPQ
jgi:RimJ/RimL family protein N-acetyltransferase